jgi:predicted transcriptional regulator
MPHEEKNMAKSVVELCAEVVTAQAQGRSMTPEEVAGSIRTVFQTLQELALHTQEATDQEGDAPETLLALRSQPQKAFQRTKVYCLECGKPFKLLSNRHLATHSLTPRAYKQKWGFPLRTSLSAQTLTARRRQLAKLHGMGTALAEWREARRQATS